MAFRQAPRIADAAYSPPNLDNEDLQDFFFDGSEDEQTCLYTPRSPTEQCAPSVLSSPSPPRHPALTNYGPKSALHWYQKETAKLMRPPSTKTSENIKSKSKSKSKSTTIIPTTDSYSRPGFSNLRDISSSNGPARPTDDDDLDLSEKSDEHTLEISAIATSPAENDPLGISPLRLRPRHQHKLTQSCDGSSSQDGISRNLAAADLQRPRASSFRNLINNIIPNSVRRKTSNGDEQVAIIAVPGLRRSSRLVPCVEEVAIEEEDSVIKACQRILEGSFDKHQKHPLIGDPFRTLETEANVNDDIHQISAEFRTSESSTENFAPLSQSLQEFESESRVQRSRIRSEVDIKDKRTTAGQSQSFAAPGDDSARPRKLVARSVFEDEDVTMSASVSYPNNRRSQRASFYATETPEDVRGAISSAIEGLMRDVLSASRVSSPARIQRFGDDSNSNGAEAFNKADPNIRGKKSEHSFLHTPRVRLDHSSNAFRIGSGNVLPFDYAQIVPEVLPKGLLKATKKNTSPLKDAEHSPPSPSKKSRQRHHPISPIKNVGGHPQLKGNGIVQKEDKTLRLRAPIRFPRPFLPTSLKVSPFDPPVCSPGLSKRGWPDSIPEDILSMLATDYLSSKDVRNLRLVNKEISESITPLLFRNVVTKFGKAMFDTALSAWDTKAGTPPRWSSLEKLGHNMNKFGISFDFDSSGLYSASPKIIQGERESFWGKYTWPLPTYPRYSELQSIEDLVDNNRPLLKDAFRNLTKLSELGLSVDSGHGWLNGPDLSDMELYEMRCEGGARIFGKTFGAEDRWHAHLRGEIFKWAQQNTIGEGLQMLTLKQQDIESKIRNRVRGEIRYLKSVLSRNYDSFEFPTYQHDHDQHNCHTGGGSNTNTQAQANAVNFPMGFAPSAPQPMQAFLTAANGQVGNQIGPALLNGASQTTGRPAPNDDRQGRNTLNKPQGPSTTPQWPLIFNGFNIAAGVGGNCSHIQERVAKPWQFPLKPGSLTEAQAQWLMETVWAQRAFLSAYTTSIIMNKATLNGVHSMHIAKLSSGLLPALEQREFWQALPFLKRLTILISPDWRTEHIPGDRSFQNNMLISPVNASVKFANFLRQYILKIERLSVLTVGFVGGGEHATGIFARNQHVLPAPVTVNPRSWLTDHVTKPNMNTMMQFNHIRELRFTNCWFSPCMLLSFMERSRDTSLRHLILDSVSLTGVHSSRNDGPINNTDNALEPQFGVHAWLQERLPGEKCWPAILDTFNPGSTFLEQKYAQGLIDANVAGPLPEKTFRGNVEKITLKSCGYARISGVNSMDFNQNDLLTLHKDPMDEGLRVRKSTMSEGYSIERPHARRPPQAMQNPPVQQNQGVPVSVVATQQPPVAGQGQMPQNAQIHVMPFTNPALMPTAMQTDTLDSSSSSSKLMMSTIDPSTGQEYFGLGKLTQTVHPIEKRVLEQAWGMSFGWGADMKRWAAVEDGCFEGGTGRFSGVISKDQ